MPRFKVAENHNLVEGEMKEVTAGDTNVLLLRLEGTIYARRGD